LEYLKRKKKTQAHDKMTKNKLDKHQTSATPWSIKIISPYIKDLLVFAEIRYLIYHSRSFHE